MLKNVNFWFDIAKFIVGVLTLFTGLFGSLLPSHILGGALAAEAVISQLLSLQKS